MGCVFVKLNVINMCLGGGLIFILVSLVEFIGVYWVCIGFSILLCWVVFVWFM